MATITINIPVDKEQWVLDGLALAFNYRPDIENPAFDDQLPEDPQTNPSTIPNPQSKASFGKEQIIEMIKTQATQGHIASHWVTERDNSNDVTLT